MQDAAAKTVLGRLANLSCSRPRRVALVGGLVFLLVGVIGGPAPGSFGASNAFDDPGSQATRAREQIERATGEAAGAGVIALVRAPRRSAEVFRVGRTLGADPGIARVSLPPASGRSAAVSRDGRQVLVAATLRAGASDSDVIKRLKDAFAGDHAVALGGTAVAGEQTGAQATTSLAIAELIAFPLLALLSLAVFRGVAALLPVAIGGFSVLGAFAVLRAINSVLSLSPFALNLVIGLGLGLAIDYSLFCVSRFREELGRGADVPLAVRRTMLTAGRTVLFSAATVAAAMACLTVFPQRFLISMGLGGLVVALVAAAGTVVFLPALLVLMGRRLGKVRPGPEGSGRWYRLARAVMRHPGVVVALTTVALLLLAMPALGIRWSGIDASVLPAGQSARTVSDAIARDFPGADSTPVILALSAPTDAGPTIRSYAGDLQRITGVEHVSAPRHLGGDTWEIDIDAPWYADHTTIAERRHRDSGTPGAISRLSGWCDGRPDRPARSDLANAANRDRAPDRAHGERSLADDRIGGAPGQGAADEPSHHRSDRRHPRSRLPRRQPHRTVGVHQARGDRANRLPRARRDRVRPLDRLWRISAHPDQGGPRPRSRQCGRRRRRLATNRRDRDGRGDPPRGRARSVCDQPTRIPQGTRRGRGDRRPD